MNKMEKKKIPDVTWKNIAPPYMDYEYFQGCKEYPFRYEAGGFDMVNAWWLIEAATLSYAEEDFARERFRSAGFDEVRFFSGDSTQCYIVSNDNFIVLAFRGTESSRREGRSDFKDILADIKADINIKLVDSGHGGKVHKGFKDALDEIWDDLRPYLNQIHQDGRKLWITGHSLGAALATLSAIRVGNVQGLYTFGSPLVGDMDFMNEYSVNTYRFVNNNDVVTKIPPPPLYHHIGKLKYIDSKGNVFDSISKLKRISDGFRGTMKNIFKSIRYIKRIFSGLIPDGLKDHVPVLYAVHIWNNIR